MVIKIADLTAMTRAINLLATVDKSQFTKEQQQIIKDGVAACVAVEQSRVEQAEKNRDFIRKRRKEVPGYNYPKKKTKSE